jgi:integrase
MPTLEKRVTDRIAASLPVPDAGYLLYWTPDTPGLAVRVTANGARAYVLDRRVNGKQVRRTLGAVVGQRNGISADAARRLALNTSSALQEGKDPNVEKREKRERERLERERDLSFGDALRQYVRQKRKRGAPLSERTQADYLDMLADGDDTRKPGMLNAITSKSIHRLTGDELRALHKKLAVRGERRQAYAAQVLRAVLRFHGVKLADSPFDEDTPAARRITVPTPAGEPTPVPADKLGAWLKAQAKVESEAPEAVARGAAVCLFLLLTGCRIGETMNLRERDYDSQAHVLTLPATVTKARRAHRVLLSTRAVGVIVESWMGRKGDPEALLFGVKEWAVREAAAKINELAGTSATPHDLRATCASIASTRCTAAVVGAMLAHAPTTVTGRHYVSMSDDALREGWQTVEKACIEAMGDGATWRKLAHTLRIPTFA